MVKSMTIMFGLLEVKITAKVRKRGFTPWKAWKKQWCNLKSSTTGLELIIHNSNPIPGIMAIPMHSVLIPDTCVCYRTDSRTKPFAFGLFLDSKSHKAIMYLAGCSETNSQEWMYAVRAALNYKQDLTIRVPERSLSYKFSIIDNAHSRAAGFLGIYGKMIVNETGLHFYQPNKNNQINSHSDISILWPHVKHCHLSGKRGGIDERKICVIHTTELFSNGIGQLLIFCTEAPKLLHAIMIQCNIILTTKLSISKQSSMANNKVLTNNILNFHNINSNKDDEVFGNSTASLHCHRISRSEGDLCGYCDIDQDSGWSSCSPPEGNSVLTFDDKLEYDIVLSSSPDDTTAVLNDKPATITLDKLEIANKVESNTDEVLIKKDLSAISVINPRRESGISIASGVYEEILEQSPMQTSQTLSALYEEPVYMPPPLPPRRRYISQTSMSDDGIEDCDDCNCSTPVTARSVHNFNNHFLNENCCKSSPVDFKVHSLRKLSVSSLNEAHIQSNFCLNNSYSKQIAEEVNQIPRCNTEPQKDLRQSQIYLETKIGLPNNCDMTKKTKNRFDLTPIKNKLNYLIRKGYNENDSSPKSRSYFYNSLPRSLNISKSRQKVSIVDEFNKETSRSCEVLDCDITKTLESKNSIRSCELLDCISKTPPKTDFLVDPILHETCESSLFTKNLKLAESLYYNLDTLSSSTENHRIVAEEPNLNHMQEIFLESEINECEYVAMSPRIETNLLQEDDYMDMTGRNK